MMILHLVNLQKNFLKNNTLFFVFFFKKKTKDEF